VEELIAFIEARLAEEAEVAQDLARGCPAPWSADKSEVRDANGDIVVCDEYHWSALPHVARHDPARALREAAAKRAILAEHARWGSLRDPRKDGGSFDCHVATCKACGPFEWPHEDKPPSYPYSAPWTEGEDEYPTFWPCATLRAVVAIWDGHPDYRPEWRMATSESD
jgi:hypothetical protein